MDDEQFLERIHQKSKRLPGRAIPSEHDQKEPNQPKVALERAVH